MSRMRSRMNNIKTRSRWRWRLGVRRIKLIILKDRPMFAASIHVIEPFKLASVSYMLSCSSSWPLLFSPSRVAVSFYFFAKWK